jgi:hypothetical protein
MSGGGRRIQSNRYLPHPKNAGRSSQSIIDDKSISRCKSNSIIVTTYNGDAYTFTERSLKHYEV